MKHLRPTHVYIGRETCGCVTAVVNDDGDKATGREVAGFIAQGRTIERVTFEDYRKRIVNEPTFMRCPHPPGQLPLLNPVERGVGNGVR